MITLHLAMSIIINFLSRRGKCLNYDIFNFIIFLFGILLLVEDIVDPNE